MTSQETDIIEQFSLAVNNTIEIVVELIKSYISWDSYAKIAVFLYSIGSELSVEIFKYLTEEEIEEITFHVATLDKIDVNFRNTTLKEFYDFLTAQQYIEAEGIDYARVLLENSLGSQKAIEIIERFIERLEK